MQTSDLEKKSSAVTLSDMEMFIFPELIYSLVLANMMSPRIWKWREDSWFKGLEKKTAYRRITRLKQYVMDHYAFNLDLDTWGLTTTERELARFSPFIGEEKLAQSNALFGYEGDKYYFDIDIRTHFGLDKYSGNVIPYWKTETVEAMDAFVHRPNYLTGAGECVSLATLYAAALFIVADIPLADIFLMATPLHSQNFIDVADGILTNNRRLVTKNMWFNGTALSAQGRRALENERVTIVAHETGVIHTLYPEATIDPGAYARMSGKLSDFLSIDLSDEILGNFLRQSVDIHKCFQFRWPRHGVDRYIGLEKAFAYENGSSYRMTDKTRDKLMEEVDGEDFHPVPLPSRIVLNDLEVYVKTHGTNIHDDADVANLKAQFASDCLNAEIALESLIRFCHVRPRMPDAAGKQFDSGHEPLGIEPGMTREDIISRLESIRDRNTIADMAFYAYRDLSRCEPLPFLLACVQRNPVSVEATQDATSEAVVAQLRAMPDESIYDDPGRLSQPDELWNFGRGDGVEKALLLANVLRSRDADAALSIRVAPTTVTLAASDETFEFASIKQLPEQTWDVP